MGNKGLVKGWMVCRMDEENPAGEKYFLDVENAVSYCEQQGRNRSLCVQQQYMRPEWAEDLHQSRLRCQPDYER